MAKMGMNISREEDLKHLLVQAMKPSFPSPQSFAILLKTLLDLGLVFSDLSYALQEVIGDALVDKRSVLTGHIREINKL